uniref:glycoside hydrolase family 2 protein n=1 Tax=Deinococcus sp. TaxID=47478 RepID=UPI002869C456
QQEAEAAVARLRHHASLALWCGNNEDYQIAESVGAGDFSAQDHLETSTFPAREIYERLLPDVCARLDPQRPYWPGSPYTPGGGATTQPTAGDRHTWDIWHGVMAPYTDYANYEGRFVSEFGLQAPPAASTIASFTKPADRHAHSRVMEHHNKAPDGSRRLAAYLSDTLNPPADFGAWVYGTRLVQAEAMQAACRAYRRRWGQEGQRAVSGALVWQLNDCWPVTSWSLIDSCGLPKPAWYAVGREFQPLAIGISREGGTLATWLCSAARQDQPLELEFTSCGLDGMQLHQEKQTVAAASNATTPVTWRVPAVPDDAAVFIRGFQNGVEVARSALWPHPLKHHDLPDPGLRVSWQGDQLDVVARGPAKAVWIEASGVPSDNHLDLMPGEHVTVTLAGAAAVEVRAVGSPVVHVANTHTG